MTTSHTPLTAADLRARLAPVYDSVLAELAELVAIPSLAWASSDPAQVQASAEAVARFAGTRGFDSVEILRGRNTDGSEGYPAVVARRAAPEGRPTVLLYAHHDVQPTGDLALWETDPFTATKKGDRLYGRGVADDKAGVLIHLAALDVLADDLNVGVVLFVEGEEEAGSPSFRDFLERYRDKLASDVIVVADSANWAAGTPALTTSLRGMCAIEFSLTTLDHDVHSGVYGGLVPDAMMAMTRLLNTLWDESGSVAVEGLVGVRESEVDYPEETVRKDSGVLPTTDLIGAGPISSRLWRQPSVTVIGLDNPPVAVSSNTLRATMRAKLSVRIAPGDSVDNAIASVKRHLEAHVPFGAQLEFGEVEGGNAWLADPEDPSVQIAQGALSEAFGTDSVFMGIGGSIPFIADLLEVFPGASILVTGPQDPDTRAHSANESLYLPDFEASIVAEALMLDRL